VILIGLVAVFEGNGTVYLKAGRSAGGQSLITGVNESDFFGVGVCRKISFYLL
jgi:hypothetical protein